MGRKVKIDGVMYDKLDVLNSLAMAAANARNIRIEEKRQLASEDEKERYQNIEGRDNAMGMFVEKLILAYTGKRIRFNKGGPPAYEMTNNPNTIRQILKELRSTGSGWPVGFNIGRTGGALENKYEMYYAIIDSVLEDIAKNGGVHDSNATGFLVPPGISELHARNVSTGNWLANKPVYFEVTKTSWYSGNKSAEDGIREGTKYNEFSITFRYAVELNEDMMPKKYREVNLELNKEEMEYFVSMYFKYLAEGLVGDWRCYTEGKDVLSQIADKYINNAFEQTD